MCGACAEQDGRLDVLVAINAGIDGGSSLAVWRNRGSDQFTLLETGAHQDVAGMYGEKAFWADVDLDGDLDIVSTTGLHSPNALYVYEHCPGAVRLGTSHACLSKPKHTYRPINADQAFECPLNSIGSTDMANCDLCTPGTDRTAGKLSCAPCAPGSATTGVGVGCTQCSPGFATDLNVNPIPTQTLAFSQLPSRL